MNIDMKKMIFLLLYILTITPLFFMVWLKLYWADIMSEMGYGSKLYCSLGVYTLLIVMDVFIVYTDKLAKHRALYLVSATTIICLINIFMPCLLFFDGITTTIVFLPTSILIAGLGVILCTIGKRIL